MATHVVRTAPSRSSEYHSFSPATASASNGTRHVATLQPHDGVPLPDYDIEYTGMHETDALTRTRAYTHMYETVDDAATPTPTEPVARSSSGPAVEDEHTEDHDEEHLDLHDYLHDLDAVANTPGYSKAYATAHPQHPCHPNRPPPPIPEGKTSALHGQAACVGNTHAHDGHRHRHRHTREPQQYPPHAQNDVRLGRDRASTPRTRPHTSSAPPAPHTKHNARACAHPTTTTEYTHRREQGHSREQERRGQPMAVSIVQMSRSQARTQLMDGAVGTFVLRKGQSHPGLTMSLRTPTAVKDYCVVQNGNKRVGPRWTFCNYMPLTFSDLSTLIAYYTTNVVSDNDGICLTRQLTQQGPFSVSLDLYASHSSGGSGSSRLVVPGSGRDLARSTTSFQLSNVPLVVMTDALG